MIETMLQLEDPLCDIFMLGGGTVSVRLTYSIYSIGAQQ